MVSQWKLCRICMARKSWRLKHSMEPGDWVIVSMIVCCVGPFPPPWAVPRPLHTPTNFWTYYLFTIAGFFWPHSGGFYLSQPNILLFLLFSPCCNNYSFGYNWIFCSPRFSLISLLIFYMEDQRFFYTWWSGPVNGCKIYSEAHL